MRCPTFTALRTGFGRELLQEAFKATRDLRARRRSERGLDPRVSARGLGKSSRRSASRTSVLVRVTRRRTPARSRRSKRLPRYAERPFGWDCEEQAHRDLVPEPALGLDPRDEARIGQKNGLVRQWARRGTRPRQPADQRYESAYLFGAICPARGTGAALALPFADTNAMQLHLDEIARTIAKGAHAVLLLDRAGWHTTRALAVPRNITMILLPSRAPELNPVENVWQYLRGNWLSNQVFDTYEDIIHAGCNAWRKLIAKPDTITSIGSREWAITGQR